MCRLMRRLAWSVVECRCHPRRRRIERAASGRDRRVERTTMSEQLRSELRPTVARIWRGRVRAERADAYETYYMEAGIQPLIDAALGVQALREDRGDEVEFVTISYWEDVAAMSRFAGDDPRRIHHLGVPRRAAHRCAGSGDPGGPRRHWRRMTSDPTPGAS
jgi:hypothetical protein